MTDEQQTMADSLRYLARVLKAHEFSITSPMMLTDAANELDSLTQQLASARQEISEYHALAGESLDAAKNGTAAIMTLTQEADIASLRTIAEVLQLIDDAIDDWNGPDGARALRLFREKLLALQSDPSLAVLTLDAREQALERAHYSGLMNGDQGSNRSATAMAESRRLLQLPEVK